MKNIFQKTALALTIAGMSAGAFAGVLNTDAVAANSNALVLANEIFGDGSQETLVATPNVLFGVNASTTGSVAAVGETVTFKFTLDKGAVFGEDLSDIQKWFDSNANLKVLNNALSNVNTAPDPAVPGVIFIAGTDHLIEVDQGGAIGDNTVTFRITVASAPQDFAGTLAAPSFEIGNFRVKNLTTALERGVANPAVRLGAEFRNLGVAAQAYTDTAPATVIFSSQDGVQFRKGASSGLIVTDYDAVGLRARIDVADTEQSFTGDQPTNTGTSAAQDFNELDNVKSVDLGNLAVIRTTVAANYGGGLVRKENGDVFDFNGSDIIHVKLSSTQPLSAFSSIYLRPAATSCDETVVATDKVAEFGPKEENNELVLTENDARISLSGDTTAELEAGYRVCAIAKGNVAIPEQSFTAHLNVRYFNPRYTNSTDNLNYGAILRNGCSVTLFNLPTTGVGDDAYIRLTNVSEKPGAVRAAVWTEDGEQIDIGAQLVDTLAAHATVVLHTNEGQGNGVFLGDVLEDYSALTSGRHRIQLQGAFPACEAMGLIRTPAGVLVNMTSTTYSGDQSRLGSSNNGTSNTSN